MREKQREEEREKGTRKERANGTGKEREEVREKVRETKEMGGGGGRACGKYSEQNTKVKQEVQRGVDGGSSRPARGRRALSP